LSLPDLIRQSSSFTPSILINKKATPFCYKDMAYINLSLPIPYAGITRIRFKGYILSLTRHPCMLNLLYYSLLKSNLFNLAINTIKPSLFTMSVKVTTKDHFLKSNIYGNRCISFEILRNTI